MKYVLLTIAVLSHLLFAAHLLFHGEGLAAAALLLAAVVLLFVRRPWAAKLQSLLFSIYGFEWLRSAFVLAQSRLALEQPWMRATLIVAACALLSWTAAALFSTKALRSVYRSNTRAASQNKGN